MKSTIYLHICIHNRIVKMELRLLLDVPSCHLLIPLFTSEVANVQRSWIRQTFIYVFYFTVLKIYLMEAACVAGPLAGVFIRLIIEIVSL